MTYNCDGFEFFYIYSPGRIPQRQHCFVISQADGMNARTFTVHVSGYGASQQKALKDLKEEAQAAGLDSGLMPSLYEQWVCDNNSVPSIIHGYLGDVGSSGGGDPDTI